MGDFISITTPKTTSYAFGSRMLDGKSTHTNQNFICLASTLEVD